MPQYFSTELKFRGDTYEVDGRTNDDCSAIVEIAVVSPSTGSVLIPELDLDPETYANLVAGCLSKARPRKEFELDEYGCV